MTLEARAASYGHFKVEWVDRGALWLGTMNGLKIKLKARSVSC